MAWTTLRWKSETIGKATTAEVLLPNVGTPPYPVFYLLHGLSDDAMTWLRHTRLEWYARHLPIMIVMPDGYRSFYTKAEQGRDFAHHIGVELPAQVERWFQARTDRAGRAIGGLSMGGYGALRVGLGHAERFGSITSHSGAVTWGNFKAKTGDQAPPVLRGRSAELVEELTRVFGENPHGTDHDITLLAQRAQAAGRLPAIRIDCGTEDFLIEDNRELHANWEAAGIPHLYKEYPGAHDWDYWDYQIQSALAYHREVNDWPRWVGPA
jgi:putative tributyrin esterase